MWIVRDPETTTPMAAGGQRHAARRGEAAFTGRAHALRSSHLSPDDSEEAPMEVLRRQLCFSRESSVDMGSDHSQRGGSFPLDMNMYATRKTLAQGMLDLALLSANACQLRRALSVPPGQRFFGASVAFLGLSIALQLLAGFLLVLLGRWNINCPWEQRRADTLNNVVVLLAFLISVVNVLLSAFSPDIQPPEDPHKVYRPQNGWFDAPQ